MKKIFLSIAVIFFCLATMAQADSTTHGQKLTLQQCVETALANNLDVFQSQLQVESAKINKIV